MYYLVHTNLVNVAIAIFPCTLETCNPSGHGGHFMGLCVRLPGNRIGGSVSLPFVVNGIFVFSKIHIMNS